MKQETKIQTITELQSCADVLKLKTVRKVLLICGIVSSLLYVGADIAAAMRYPGYSYIDQTFSELLAIGSPVRPFMVAMASVYNPLVIAFGIGVWGAAGRKRSLRITAVLLLAYGVASFLGPFVPVHVRGSEGTLTDTMHIIITIVIVLSILLAMGFGAAARGKAFRLYSIGTLVTVALFGALAGMQAPRIAAQLPTPWLGVIERVNIYSLMLWVLVLAVTLLRADKGQSLTHGIDA